MAWLFGKKGKKKEEKQNKDVPVDAWTVCSPCAGTLIPQDAIDDPEFSTGVLGPGVGIIPKAGRIVAPVSGVLRVIFQQGHALGLVADNGIQVLIHIGTDTVALNGIGFKKRVWEGDRVKRGDVLMEFDPALIRKFGLNDTVVLSISNPREFDGVNVIADYHTKLEPGQPVLQVLPKAGASRPE